MYLCLTSLIILDKLYKDDIMSTNQKAQEPQLYENEIKSSYDTYKLIDSVFQELPKKYKLNKAETITLKATFFYTLYNIRKLNDALDEYGIGISYDVLKSIVRQSIQVYNKNTLSTSLSHSWFITKLREKLSIKKGQDISNKLFQLYNLDICTNDIEIPKKSLAENKAIEYTKFILKKFDGYVIPLELYVVIWCDVTLTLLENSEYFKSFSSDYEKLETYKIITHQISTIGKRISDYSYVLQSPPLKQDFSFNMNAQTIDNTCSLQLLADYFGDESWHKQFPNYEENNAHEYFCYNEEPHIKISINERTYKQTSIKAKSQSEFLSDKNKEDFFKQWESRLYKNEKHFFREYVKPIILQGISTVKVNNTEENKILVKGIFNTANFEYHYDGLFGSCTVIESTSTSDQFIELKISQDLFNT